MLEASIYCEHEVRCVRVERTDTELACAVTTYRLWVEVIIKRVVEIAEVACRERYIDCLSADLACPRVWQLVSYRDLAESDVVQSLEPRLVQYATTPVVHVVPVSTCVYRLQPAFLNSFCIANATHVALYAVSTCDSSTLCEYAFRNNTVVVCDAVAFRLCAVCVHPLRCPCETAVSLVTILQRALCVTVCCTVAVSVRSYLTTEAAVESDVQ